MVTVIREWGEQEKTLIGIGVAKLLASPAFASSARQQRFLQYLVTQTLAGQQDRLKGYTIGVEVFDRDADFDPNVDAIVRVEAVRLRAKLREFYDSPEGQASVVLIELPKGSYTINLRLRQAMPSPQDEGMLAKPRRRAEENIPSLAVLPFNNLNPDAGQAYFVDGITDSLIFELSRLSGLLVISRQSSFSFRNKENSSQTIAAALGVQYLLEGSIQRSGQRVRVTVQLIDARSDGHIWSERYESDLQEIFALQDAITHSIVKALQVELASAEAALFGHEATSSIEAHDALLRGLECHWKYTPKYIAEARGFFSKAVAHDPDYAAAHAWLARSMLFQWIMRWDQDGSLKAQAYAHAIRAVELNPQLPYALTILGWAQQWSKDRKHSLIHCRQAVALDPNNSEALNFLSMNLSLMGFGEEALYYVEKARRLNPHSSPFYEFTLGIAHFVMENYERAITAFTRGTEMNDTFIPNHLYLCFVFALLCREQELAARRVVLLGLIGGDTRRMLAASPWMNDKLAANYDHLLELSGLADHQQPHFQEESP